MILNRVFHIILQRIYFIQYNEPLGGNVAMPERYIDYSTDKMVTFESDVESEYGLCDDG